ncbi:hypothetical protein BC940DRAFT_150783 [Gongronella butleri]|nr:hypothetical protein BC940DRAFT_150783 [Gongronella butleri]
MHARLLFFFFLFNFSHAHLQINVTFCEASIKTHVVCSPMQTRKGGGLCSCLRGIGGTVRGTWRKKKGTRDPTREKNNRRTSSAPADDWVSLSLLLVCEMELHEP